MPRVVHVLRKFEPSAWGGIETHLMGLLPELARLGWESEVHAPAENGTDGAPITELGATFRTFRARYPYVGLTCEKRAALVASGGNLVSTDELVRLTRDRRADVFHAHTQGRLGGVVRLAARLRSIPYAVTLHGPVRADQGVVERDAARRTRGMLDLGAPFGLAVGARRVVDDADLVFVLNRSERDGWRDSRAGRHLGLVSLGIDARPANAEARIEARRRVGVGDAPFALVVGRLDRAKGQDLALGAFLRAAPAGMRLVLVGAPMDESYVRELVALRHGDPRVIAPGNVTPRLARALLAECELAMVPSRSEPFGLVLLEAWAEGAPAIFSAVGGLSDIATRASAESGLVREGTVDGWAASLSRALEDPEFRDRERRLGPERVRRHFSYRRFAEEIAQGYRDAIHQRRRLRYGACKAVVT